MIVFVEAGSPYVAQAGLHLRQAPMDWVIRVYHHGQLRKRIEYEELTTQHWTTGKDYNP